MIFHEELVGNHSNLVWFLALNMNGVPNSQTTDIFTEESGGELRSMPLAWYPSGFIF
uniref:Uncharacterized protein n=1 Tax=Rhizophora mucronata TaxID=61149 RepID=A0A2P2PPJ8_RHIMU